MKTEVVFAVRCNPTRTKRLLESIESKNPEAVAYITELIRNKAGEVLCSTRGFKRVFDFEDLKKAAEAGFNVIYKTASLSRCAKFYVQSGAVDVLGLATM